MFRGEVKWKKPKQEGLGRVVAGWEIFGTAKPGRRRSKAGTRRESRFPASGYFLLQDPLEN